MARNIADTCPMLASRVGAHAGDPLSFPQDTIALARSSPIDLFELLVGWSVDFGTETADPAVANASKWKIAAISGLFATCDEISIYFGEAESCFDIICATSFVARCKNVYNQDPMRLGPNVRTNYEMSAKMSLGDFAWHTLNSIAFSVASRKPTNPNDVLLAPSVAVSPFS